MASAVHCDGPRKDLCAHVVRLLCVDGRGGRLLFRERDAVSDMHELKSETKQKTYISTGVCPAHNFQTRKIANTPLGYEICLAELLCKCCDEDNLPPETLCQSLISANIRWRWKQQILFSES